MRKVLKCISYLLLGTIIVFVLLILINVFFFNNKYKTAIVLSGSMEPEISVNDLVILKRTENIHVGDIVSYNDGKNQIMHRIIKIDGNTITTKGDANNVSDKEITKDQITGVYVFHIKYIGNIINFFKTPIGLLVLLLIMVLVIITPMNKDVLKDRKMLFGIIGYLVIVGAMIIAGYYAEYRKELSGEGTGTVARIRTDRAQTLKIDASDLYPGSTSNYYFGIKNSKNLTSEVSIKYSIKINSTNNIPLKYSIKCLDKTDGSCLTKDNIGINEVIDAGVMNLKDTTHSYELSISWPEEYNDVSYMSELEVIKIDIVAEQID